VLVNDRVDGIRRRSAGQPTSARTMCRLTRCARTSPGFVLGASVGSPAEAAGAGWRADYWSVGPAYAAANKADAGVPLGPAGFAALARLAPSGVPVIAIGGITAGNAADLARVGAVGLAVIGAVLATPDPESATRAIRDRFDATRAADVTPR
jgi:thiamine-phosphate pyrophosphorylase